MTPQLFRCTASNLKVTAVTSTYSISNYSKISRRTTNVVRRSARDKFESTGNRSPTLYHPSSAGGSNGPLRFFHPSCVVTGLFGYFKRGLVDVGSAVPFIVTSLPACLLGAVVVPYTDERVLKALYAVLMIGLSVYLLFGEQG